MLIDSAQSPVRRGNRIVLLASLGGTLEFYDFVIFGVFAKDIADAIFPNPTPLVSLMVVVCRVRRRLPRPADRRHRPQPLRRSVRPPPRVPDLDLRHVRRHARHGAGAVVREWGAAASLLMVALRLVQGFCLGGELPGALTYVVETAPRHRAVRLRRRVFVRDDGRGGWRPVSASRCAPGCRPSSCRASAGASRSCSADSAAC